MSFKKQSNMSDFPDMFLNPDGHGLLVAKSAISLQNSAPQYFPVLEVSQAFIGLFQRVHPVDDRFYQALFGQFHDLDEVLSG